MSTKKYSGIKFWMLGGINAIGVMSFSGQALAQEGVATFTLEEVIVTAQKRSESLSDVPIAIATVGGDEIRSAGIEKLEDLSATIPAFSLSEAVAGGDRVFLRGIGSGNNPGFEQAVGTVVDGYFYGRSRFGRLQFLDIERVEVLKGPQGALLGKNTTGGAINITSVKPTEHFEGWASVNYLAEGGEGPALEGAVSGPLSDTVRARLAVRYEDRDGYLKNTTTGEDVVQTSDYAGRLSVVWDASEDLEITGQWQTGKIDNKGRNNQISLCAPALAAQLEATGVVDDCTANYSVSSLQTRNGEGNYQGIVSNFDTLGLTAEWEVGDFTVTSLTGYAEYDYVDQIDTDRTSAEVVSALFTEDYNQISQELRIATASDGNIDFIAGLFYQKAELQTAFIASLAPLGSRPILTDQDGDTKAAFGQATWHINSEFDVTLGGRFTKETKDASQEQFGAELYTLNPQVFTTPALGLRNVHSVAQDRDESNFSPTFSLQWHPNEDFMFYGSVKKGFKGGGFDHLLASDQAGADLNFQFEEEEVTAYEFGGKLSLLDNTAQLNFSLFRSEFTGLQVSNLTGPFAFAVGNAAEATTEGLEVDFRWRVTEGLTLFGALASMTAEYDTYPDAPCYNLQTEANGCGASGTQDLTGSSLFLAPELTYTMNAEYVMPLGDKFELTGLVQFRHSDDFFLALDLDPNLTQDKYNKVDASIRLSDVEGRWVVALIGKNLTDKLTTNVGNDLVGPPYVNGSYYRFVEPPRQLTLQAQVNF